MLIRTFGRLAAVVGVAAMFALTAVAQEKGGRDIYDLDAQRKSSAAKKIVFIADRDTHGARGNHEFIAALTADAARTENGGQQTRTAPHFGAMAPGQGDRLIEAICQ